MASQIEKFRTLERWTVRTQNGCGFTSIIANSSEEATTAAEAAGLEDFLVVSMKVLDTDKLTSVYEILENDGSPTGLMFNCVANAIGYCKEHDTSWKTLYVLE